MRVRRSRPAAAAISLVSMIDVLMILLIFFMVTSTYLDLTMIPMAERQEEPAETFAPAQKAAEGGASLLIRLGADGIPRVRGKPQTDASLADLLARHRAARPDAAVIVLPSGHADAQALVRVLDRAAQAGMARIRVLRLEGRP